MARLSSLPGPARLSGAPTFLQVFRCYVASKISFLRLRSSALSALFPDGVFHRSCRLGARAQLCRCQLAELFPQPLVNTKSCYQSHGSNLAEPMSFRRACALQGCVLGRGLHSWLDVCGLGRVAAPFLSWPKSECPLALEKSQNRSPAFTRVSSFHSRLLALEFFLSLDYNSMLLPLKLLSKVKDFLKVLNPLNISY